jgi:hypothetical protein
MRELGKTHFDILYIGKTRFDILYHEPGNLKIFFFAARSRIRFLLSAVLHSSGLVRGRALLCHYVLPRCVTTWIPYDLPPWSWWPCSWGAVLFRAGVHGRASQLCSADWRSPPCQVKSRADAYLPTTVTTLPPADTPGHPQPFNTVPFHATDPECCMICQQGKLGWISGTKDSTKTVRICRRRLQEFLEPKFPCCAH